MFKAPQINGINPKKGNSSFGSNPFFTAQTKLSVGKADDAYEKEADAVADKIVQKSEGKTPENTFFPPAAIQKKSQENDVEELQKKPIADSITPVLHLKELEEETLQRKCEDCEKEEANLQKKEDSVAIQTKCEACENEEKTIQKKAAETKKATNSSIENTLSGRNIRSAIAWVF